MQLRETLSHYFAVPIPGGEKACRVPGWQWKDFSPEQIERHVREGGNLGLRAGSTRTGPNLVVIDLDGMDAETMDFLKRYGLDSPNMQVETASGKWHGYFMTMEVLKTRIKLRSTMLDVKATGYVVAPDSRINGGAYRFIEGPKPPDDLTPLPSGFLELLREDTVQKTKTVFAQQSRPPTRTDVRSPRAYIRSIPSVQGQGGSKGLVRVCCVLKSLGLSTEEAWNILVEWNEGPNVSPPWSMTELTRAFTRFFLKE